MSHILAADQANNSRIVRMLENKVASLEAQLAIYDREMRIINQLAAESLKVFASAGLAEIERMTRGGEVQL
ncbi:MAG: hypothetical protein KAZ26_23535 [Caldilineaceae bacterium]|nr:hypothetical protein [Caldilineaceae bacterium]